MTANVSRYLGDGCTRMKSCGFALPTGTMVRSFSTPADSTNDWLSRRFSRSANGSGVPAPEDCAAPMLAPFIGSTLPPLVSFAASAFLLNMSTVFSSHGVGSRALLDLTMMTLLLFGVETSDALGRSRAFQSKRLVMVGPV